VRPRPLRIVVALTHALHVRNFVASGCLQRLAERGHALTLVVPAFARTEVERETAGWPNRPALLPLEVTLPGRGRRWVRAWSHVASFVHRRRFKTYQHKIRMSARLSSPTFALQVGVALALARLGDVERFWRRVETALPAAPGARAMVERLRPDVLFTPTLVHDGREVELVKAAQALGVPTVGFAASWDTLTSKGAFYVPPDHLLVWGQENREQAMSHHGFAADRVEVTGTPQFDVYGAGQAGEDRTAFLARRGIAADRRVLLFAGTTVTYWEDEPRLLRALSAAIEQGELKDCAIWYRPHPRRPLREVADVTALPHVVLDDQAARQKAEGLSSYSARPEDLLHYRGLMNAVDGVVTAFSTMILEAALLGKPSLVIGFGVDVANAGRLIQHAEYEHSVELLATPGVTLCRGRDELLREIQRLLAGEYAVHAGALRARAAAIAHNLDGGARDRIAAALERIAGAAR
jgi:CDP-Glycerol:Poly(glycerophosphate) glycerophosphotransferase